MKPSDKGAFRNALSGQAKGLLVFLFLFFASIVISGVIIYRRHNVPQFLYREHLDDVLLRVDGEDITLRAFGYYVYETEGYVQRQALIYDEEDPVKYWITHYAAGMDSTFMYDYALQTALDTCIRDRIYAHLALEEGMYLSPEEEEKAKEDASRMYHGMSDAQKDITGLTLADIEETEKLRRLSGIYAKAYAASHDLKGYGGTPAQVLSYDGAYYQQYILPKHTVIRNEELIENIRFGGITVNMTA